MKIGMNFYKHEDGQVYCLFVEKDSNAKHELETFDDDPLVAIMMHDERFPGWKPCDEIMQNLSDYKIMPLYGMANDSYWMATDPSDLPYPEMIGHVYVKIKGTIFNAEKLVADHLLYACAMLNDKLYDGTIYEVEHRHELVIGKPISECFGLIYDDFEEVAFDEIGIDSDRLTRIPVSEVNGKFVCTH